MSNSQLEDIKEENRAKHIAAQLGITTEELDETNYEVESETSNDGLVYGHFVKFSADAPKHILDKITNLENNVVYIDLPEEQEEEEFDPHDNGDEKLSDDERKIAEQAMFRIAEENRRKGLGG